MSEWTPAEMIRLACAGSSRFVVIEAPAGYGKTAMLDDIRRQAHAAGMQVLAARANGSVDDCSFSLPRALFAPMLAANGFEAGGFAQQAIDDPTAAAQLFGQLAIGLAQEQPLCLAIDDAHLADRASVEWLVELSGCADRVPLLVAAAGRRRAGGAIDVLLDEPGVVALRPAATGAAAVRARTAAAIDDPSETLARTVFEVTGGAPYLVDAVLEALMTGTDRPEDGDELIRLTLDHVGPVVRTRIARGGADVLAVAHAAAVLESDAERARVATLAGLAEDRVATLADTLADDGFAVSGWPLQFSRPVVAAAVRASMTAAERSRLHAGAAATLIADNAPPAAIGRHVMQAEPNGDSRRVESLRCLARGASDQGRPEPAVTYLRRALREQPAGPQLAAVTLELGLAEAAIAPTAAIERLELAAELAAEPGADPSMRRQALTELARVLVTTGSFDRAAAVGERLLAALDADDDAGRLDVVTGLLMISQLAATPAAGNDSWLAELTAAAAGGALIRPGTVGVLAFAEFARGGDRDRVTALGRRALDEAGAAAAGRPWVSLALRALDGVGELDTVMIDGDDAGGAALRAALTCASRGELRQVADVVESGPTVDATVRAELAVLGASAYLEMGQFDAARALLAPIAAVDGAGAVAAHYARGRLRLAEGFDDAGIADVLAVGERLVAAGIVNPAVCGWRGTAAVALARSGVRDRASALADDEVAHAERFGAPRPLGIALIARGLVRGGAGGLDDLSAAVDLLAATTDRLEHARALLGLGAAQRRGGQRRVARESLSRARLLAEACGAQLLVAGVEAELRLAGARSVQRPQRGAAALTPAERRVALMAAGGATNTEVASALFLSPKTVEMHLSNVYRKLDIAKRRDLAAALGEVAA